MSRQLRTWPKFIVFVVVVGGAIWIVNSTVQHAVYAPDPNVAATPAGVGLAFDNVAFQTPDVVTLHGWFLPAGDEKSEVAARTHPTVLFLHGNRGNVSAVIPKLRALHEAGLNVFTFDYRGFGKSNGTPSERGLNLDALAAYFHLTGKYAVPAERLFLYGEGLGAAVAIQLATHVPAAGMITEGAFTSLPDVLEIKPSFIPWRLLLFRNQFNALAKVNRIRMPLLLLHSSQDDVVPYRQAERLFFYAANPKQLVPVTGTHDTAFAQSKDLIREQISAFVAKTNVPAAAHERPTAVAGQTS